MVSPVIAFFDTKPYDQEFFDQANQSFLYQIKYVNVRLDETTVALCQGCEVVCAFVNDTLSAPVIERMIGYGVKLLALRCAGYNHVDFTAAFGRLHVVRVPAYSPYAVAEYAVALMLALNRKIHKAYDRTRDGNFTIHGLLGFDMHGKVAGIIGTGAIGRVVADILRGFGMTVLVRDLFPDQEWASRSGCRYVTQEELYEVSDIISLHCPLMKETVHLIDEKAIARMKKGVMIINTGRGQLVDTRALIEALKSGHVGAAGLDVYEEEHEYFFEDFSNKVLSDDMLARLLVFPNVLLTAHQAFFTREAMEKIARTTLTSIKEFVDGRPLTNEICYRCCRDHCVKKEKGRCF